MDENTTIVAIVIVVLLCCISASASGYYGYYNKTENKTTIPTIAPLNLFKNEKPQKQHLHILFN